jgi:uncharacterized protein YjbI with pentapeptide repeats
MTENENDKIIDHIFEKIDLNEIIEFSSLEDIQSSDAKAFKLKIIKKIQKKQRNIFSFERVENLSKKIATLSVIGGVFFTGYTLYQTLEKAQKEIDDRKSKLLAENWSIVTKNNPGISVDGGRKAALEFLHDNKEILFNLQLNKVALPYLNLPPIKTDKGTRGAQLQNSSFREGELSHAYLVEANLGKVDFSSDTADQATEMISVNLNSANLLGANFQNTGLKLSCFANTIMTNTKFNMHTDIQGSVFGDNHFDDPIQFFASKDKDEKKIETKLINYLLAFDKCIKENDAEMEKNPDKVKIKFQSCIIDNLKILNIEKTTENNILTKCDLEECKMLPEKNEDDTKIQYFIIKMFNYDQKLGTKDHGCGVKSRKS